MIWLNSLIALMLPYIPRSLVKIVARHYIAGETLEQAVIKTKQLNRQKIQVTLDLLGEDPVSKVHCTQAVRVYEKTIEAIHVNGLGSGISLKPSHMGLKLDKNFCLENIRHLAGLADKHQIFVRIDMEDASLCQETLDLFSSLNDQFSNVGIVVQAYLRRSIDDVNTLISQGANLRLCKGAYYWENRSTAYKDRRIVNESYVYLLEKLLSRGCFVGIATHDEQLIFHALRLIDKLDLTGGAYEFQMLYGVEEQLRKILVDSGHPVRVYLPFGKQWFAYSVRRLKENPKMVGYILANAVNLLKNCFKKKKF
ncbi:MAG: proline dehydrogenase family protein [Proteobacteria bacterium]|nr:proline dehydrogenase family protein [Pseudomonadota bacterium]